MTLPREALIRGAITSHELRIPMHPHAMNALFGLCTRLARMHYRLPWERRLRRRIWHEAPRRPNFLIVGGMKCGSTSLHSWIAKHPHAFMSKQKELHHFGFPRGAGRLRGYLRHFAAAGDDARIIGESSTDYICIPGALERIHELDPGMRLALIIRHPVERAVSQYWMNRRNGRESLPMAQAFAAERGRMRWGGYWCWEHAYARRSTYMPDIRRAWELFGRERVRVLTIEDLEGESDALHGLLQWLGLDPNLRPDAARHLNPGHWTETPDPEALAYLSRATADATRALYDETGIDYRAPWTAQTPARQDAPDSVTLSNGSRYRLHPTPAAWSEAMERSAMEQGRLLLGCNPTVGEINSARNMMALAGITQVWAGAARIGGLRFAAHGRGTINAKIAAFAQDIPEGHGMIIQTTRTNRSWLATRPVDQPLRYIVETLPT